MNRRNATRPGWRIGSLGKTTRRIGYALGSAILAAIFMGLFAPYPLAWNSLGYWLFVGAIFCLGLAFYGRID